MEKNIRKLIISYSIIIGLIYCLLIFIQNQYFYKSPVVFSGAKFACYLLIIAALFFLGLQFRKENGGYIGFKDLLRKLLIAILIIEIIYAFFSVIYILYIEPDFFNKLKMVWLDYADNLPLGDDQKEEMKNRMIQPFENEETGKITLKNVLKGFGYAILIDSIVAIIISGIIKKPKPIFIEETS